MMRFVSLNLSSMSHEHFCNLCMWEYVGLSLSQIFLYWSRSLVRLAIYRVSNQRLLLHGGLASIDSYACTGPNSTVSKAKRTLVAFDHFRRKHLLRSNSIPVDQNVKGGQDNEREYWWSTRNSINISEQVKCIQNLERQITETNNVSSKLLVAGEILHILRPVMYTACLRTWGVKSWKPWALSLLVELSSARATNFAQRHSNRVMQQYAWNSTLSMLYAKQGIVWNPQELDELTKRKLLLVFYLIRDPVFGKVTLPIMQKWVQMVSRVPMVSWLSERLVDFIQGIQKYYTYTSAA